MEEIPIKCSCGKLIAKERNGKIYVWCKECKKEIELNINLYKFVKHIEK